MLKPVGSQRDFTDVSSQFYPFWQRKQTDSPPLEKQKNIFNSCSCIHDKACLAMDTKLIAVL